MGEMGSPTEEALMVSREDPPGHVRSWRRGNRERLYVIGSDGRRLGFLDVATGLPHRVPAARRHEFDATLDQYFDAQRRTRLRSTGRDQEDPPEQPLTTKLRPLEATPAGTPVDEIESDAEASASRDGSETHTRMPVGPGTLVPG
ncbi:hypothetical protein, partial [Amycolatopsis thailandensis]|uniref:hypothetical protein n=1 Tax=Amycolatopsis thailandensis TaxID=589330 RepID=UPI00363FBF1A